MDLQEAISVIWRRKWSILALTFLMMGVAVWVSNEQTPVYQSTASVLVQPLDLGGTQPVPPNIATEVEIVSSVAVAEIVVENLELDVAPRDLLPQLAVDTPVDTEVLELSYEHPVPAEARRRAQGFADGYLEYRRLIVSEELLQSAEAAQAELEILHTRLDELDEDLDRLSPADSRRATLESEASLLQGLILQRQLDQLALPDRVTVGNVVQPAALPSAPASPNHVTNVGFGLIAGLGLGIALAFLRDRLSGRLRTAPEVEAVAGTGVLASIPQIQNWNKRKIPLLISRSEWNSPAAEAYRMLRTNLQSLVSSQALRSVLITSPRGGEGKSATVANLGFVLSAAGKRVILISADLRRPRLHEFFDLPPAVGLTDVLLGRTRLEQALFPIRPTRGEAGMEMFKVLPSGSAIENPAELLSRGAMGDVLRDLEQQADLILIDAPPLLPVSDALVLAPMVSGVLLVLGPRNTTAGAVSSSRQQLNRVAANTLGIVLNGHDEAMGAAYYGYG